MSTTQNTLTINTKLLATHDNYINSPTFYKEPTTTLKSIIKSEKGIHYTVSKSDWPIWVREGILHAWDSNRIISDLEYDFVTIDTDKINNKKTEYFNSPKRKFQILAIAEIDKSLSTIVHRITFNPSTLKDDFYLGHFYRFWYIYETDKITDFYPANAVDSASLEAGLPSYLPDRKLMNAKTKCFKCKQYHPFLSQVKEDQKVVRLGKQLHYYSCILTQAIQDARLLKLDKKLNKNFRLLNLQYEAFEENMETMEVLAEVSKYQKVLYYSKPIYKSKLVKYKADIVKAFNNESKVYVKTKFYNQLNTLIYKKRVPIEKIIACYSENLQHPEMQVYLNEAILESI